MRGEEDGPEILSLVGPRWSTFPSEEMVEKLAYWQPTEVMLNCSHHGLPPPDVQTRRQARGRRRARSGRAPSAPAGLLRRSYERSYERSLPRTLPRPCSGHPYLFGGPARQQHPPTGARATVRRSERAPRGHVVVSPAAGS